MRRLLEVTEHIGSCLCPLPESAAGVRELLTGPRVLYATRFGKGDLSDWVELMEAVEALCPVWPAAPMGERGGYRL
ncbi:hypothetical protein HDE78_000725 [Rhodanobacter sp. K2T2]|nr:hypothetical protein [Rhodanobacter sp. K2T2]